MSTDAGDSKEPVTEKPLDSSNQSNTENDLEDIHQDSANVLRSMTVIYGFFFVFMSAMVAGAQNIKSGLDVSNSLLFYLIIFILGIACFLIGLEIFVILRKFGMSIMGENGIQILII